MTNKIAILIPCYNSATFLPELFEGIQAQTIPFDEIICYDDCSTDNTIAVAEKLGAKVITGKKNHGPAYARNRMMEACTSDYIHFHDSDDLIDPGFTSCMHRALENEDVQFLCNTYVLDRKTRMQNLGNISYKNLNDEADQLKYFLQNVGFASMGLYSRKALMDIDGFREDIMGNEDPDLHVRLSKKGYIIKPIDKFLVTKLEHETSFSHQNWFRCLADKLTCLETYFVSLDHKYHVIIGTQAAELSNYFYREHNADLSRKARTLAYKCGIKTLDSGTLAKVSSKMFGLAFYLWLYRRRVDLKLV